MNLETLQKFKFERVLNEDPASHSTTVLGGFPLQDGTGISPAILRIEKLSLPSGVAENPRAIVNDFSLTESTDVYSWGLGWLKPTLERPDVKINIIHPATEVHIRKYSAQELRMVHETAELYERITKPYMDAFPPSRIQWVYDILSGKSEAEKVLFKDPSPESGFVILPDMKWDLITMSTLYLVAIVLTQDIRCLRDLRKHHLGMLRNIRSQATKVVQEKWGLADGSLRFYVHYQPSYYHFHVHIVHVKYVGTMGSTVGQAHLLDDIISLLELDSDDGPSVLERMTFTYALGEQHGLYKGMLAAQAGLDA
ncbi:scavenger mRNA decapping enzyme [Cristinia sonorae]|uniref:m7GpppX diphosphatase n=1 Tax=Cristinia sonorae TaxID=1940300 RepID=A0A8K0UEW0_9AGAR|nr:scavenger mRNA decapping enzyme [Cristinia sonorae]